MLGHRVKWHDKNRKLELAVWLCLLLAAAALAVRFCLVPLFGHPQRQFVCGLVTAPPLVSFLSLCARSQSGSSRDVEIVEDEQRVSVSVLLDADTSAPRYFSGEMPRTNYQHFWQAALAVNAFDMKDDPNPRTNAAECVLSIREYDPWCSTTVVIDPAQMVESPYSQYIAVIEEALAATPLKQAKRVTIKRDTVSEVTTVSIEM